MLKLHVYLILEKKLFDAYSRCQFWNSHFEHFVNREASNTLHDLQNATVKIIEKLRISSKQMKNNLLLPWQSALKILEQCKRAIIYGVPYNALYNMKLSNIIKI